MGRVMVGTAILAALMLGGCVTQPLPTVANAMPEVRQAAATPAGFVSFCMRFADQCRAAPGSSSAIVLSDQNWRTLTRINRDVNTSIWPQDDLTHYGRAEYWTIPTDGYGDCDDYAVTKRKELADAGLPLAALRLAVVFSQRSGRHAILTVATDKGDFVLDNLADDILPWNATTYTWIERQDAADPMKWVSLSPVMVAGSAPLPAADPSPTAGSNAPTSGIASTIQAGKPPAAAPNLSVAMVTAP